MGSGVESAVGELGSALVAEGVHAFKVVVGRAQLGLQARFHLQRSAQFQVLRVGQSVAADYVFD